MRKYFVPKHQVDPADVVYDDLSRFDEFTIRRNRTGRNIGPTVVGSFKEKTSFDNHGHRRVTLEGGARGDIHIMQAITRLRPDYVTVESTSHRWEHGLSTWTIPAPVLDSLLTEATDPGNPSDRMSIVRFYSDAGLYSEAQRELGHIVETFPEMRDQVDEAQRRLGGLIAVKALNELHRRRQAGQHQLAEAYARSFPADKVSVDMLRQARDIAQTYDKQSADMERARMMLGQLQAQLPEELAAQVGPLRSIVIDELHRESLDRLEPFLRAEHDTSLSAEEKLGLAYSGWTMGAPQADTNLSAALRLWQVRFLVLQYLRSTDEATRTDVLRELAGIDDASVAHVAAMVPLLPLPLETPLPEAGVPTMIDVPHTQPDATPVRYAVTLPPEYTPHHRYPLLVVLHSQGMLVEQELEWWAGITAQPGHTQRRGYLTIAPEYATSGQREYDYSTAAHNSVLESIRDVRQRFQVDSDRIYIAGHGMGGDAVFDIAMSHPDLFAGAIPIAGIADRYCKWYCENSEELGWYVVGGELDRDALERNAANALNRMVKSVYDLVYCEYTARGYETYYEELDRLFDWMELHRRVPQQHEFTMNVLRPGDRRFYWLEVSDFPENTFRPIVWAGDQKTAPRPQTIVGQITPGNTIRVKSSGRRARIRLSPELCNLDERVRVIMGTRRVFSDFVTPNLQSLLEDLRLRGDRQRLYWVQIDL